MTRWIFEPGHTAATFRARHMMVTWVRGKFSNVRGWLDFDPEAALESVFEGEIDAAGFWTGQPERDAHLRSSDFFDVEHHPTIRFRGRATERIGDTHALAAADLTIRGVTRSVVLDVEYLGEWETPFWVGDENRGTMRRIGFEARTRVNRFDFGVSWQDSLPLGGVAVSKWVDVAIDAEAMNRDDLERTGAIEHYR
jgi:polyisoprenoid-binding protein YceI